MVVQQLLEIGDVLNYQKGHGDVLNHVKSSCRVLFDSSIHPHVQTTPSVDDPSSSCDIFLANAGCCHPEDPLGTCRKQISHMFCAHKRIKNDSLEKDALGITLLSFYMCLPRKWYHSWAKIQCLYACAQIGAVCPCRNQSESQRCFSGDATLILSAVTS